LGKFIKVDTIALESINCMVYRFGLCYSSIRFENTIEEHILKLQEHKQLVFERYYALSHFINHTWNASVIQDGHPIINNLKVDILN
jgi:hypothetical protein